MGKRWSNEEIKYLEDNWYHVTNKYIANKLKRTESSVSTKAYKIGLSTKMLYYSVYEVSLMLGVSKAKINRNINNGKLRAYKDRTLHKRFSIKEEDLKEWMINNQDSWDSRKLTINFFSIKDEWFQAKVEKDKKKSIRKGEAYTTEEDKAMVYMYRRNYSAFEIAKHLGRDKKSVQNRLENIKYGIGMY